MKNLIFIIGAPAVGKMTVGKALSQRLGLPLFHNHMSIEFALNFFDFGTEGFFEISETVRQSVFSAVAKSELPGLIVTFVWALNLEEDAAYIKKIAEGWVEKTGGKVCFLELVAEDGVKSERNRHPERLAAKPSMRDVEASEGRRQKAEEGYVFDSGGHLPLDYPHIRIDNTALIPEEVVERFITEFCL